jgi:hypothetical protein
MRIWSSCVRRPSLQYYASSVRVLILDPVPAPAGDLRTVFSVRSTGITTSQKKDAVRSPGLDLSLEKR